MDDAEENISGFDSGERWLFDHTPQHRKHHMPKTSEMIVSKFLRKEDAEEDIVVTIADTRLEAMQGNSDETRWVLYFRELQKGMVLNTTSIRVLEQAYGNDSDMWNGKRVTLYVDPNVSYQGRVVGGLRLKPLKTAKPAPKPAPAEDPDDSEVPF